jgi:cardiolipin synthase
MKSTGLPEPTFIRERIEAVYKARFIGGNQVEVLAKGWDTFERIFQAIRDARELICLQFYIFRNDATGTALANLLREKAAHGVRVHVLYDFHGSLSTPRSFWRRLRESGVRVRASRPLSLRSPGRYVFRDHRKVIIMDGTSAFVGGLNIGNEYRGWFRKRVTSWRDTGVLIEGPATTVLLENFQKAWVAGGGRPIAHESEAEPHPGGLHVLPIFAHSGRGRRRLRRLLYYSMNHARRSMDLTTAYFIPSWHMVATLEKAVKRGVRVRLLVPGWSDVKAAHYAGRAFFTRLLRAGVEIWAYQGPMLHAKSYLFDGLWSIVGSANLDPRSLRWNDEGNAGILDTNFAARMTGLFEDDLTKSKAVKLEEWLHRPLSEKLLEWFFALFRRRL